MTYNAHAWPPDAAVNREAAPLTSSDMLAGTLTVYCRAGDDLTGHGSLRIQQGTAGAWIVARVEKVPEGSDCGDGPVDPNRRLSAVNAAAVARQQALTVHRERVADGVPRVWLDGNVLKRVLGVVDGQQVHVNALEDPHPNVDDTQHDAFWHSIVLRLRRQDTDTCAALALDLVNVDSLHKSLCGRAIANGQHMLLPLINGAFVVVVIEAYPGVTSDSSDNPAMLRCVNSATRILFRTDTSPLPRLPVEGDDDAALMLLRKCFGFTARRLAAYLQNFLQSQSTSADLHAPIPFSRVLVHGASGIGKSYMIAETLRQFHLTPLILTHMELIAVSVREEVTVCQALKLVLDRHSRQHPYTVVIFDNIEQHIPRESRDMAEKYGLIRELLGPHFSNAFIIGVTRSPAAMSSWFRSRFFDIEVEVPLPNLGARAAILAGCIRSTVEKFGGGVVVAGADVGVDERNSMLHIVRPWSDRCHGFMPADIGQLWSKAVEHAARHSSLSRLDVTTADLDNGLEAARLSASLLRTALSGGGEFLNASAADENATTWEDIGGLEDVKKQLRSEIDLLLKTSAYLAGNKGSGGPVKQFRRRKTLRLSAGILLYGPPGTGKTMLARAIASQSHANFLPVSMPDLVKAEVGASEKALAGVFRLARECRPCILFLDEVDAVFGGEQGAGRENGSDAVLAKLTAQLLLEMDAIHDPVFASPTGRVASMEEELQSGGILIVAATNVPGALRAAVLRSGRLDRQVYVPPPDMDARRSILRSYMQRMALSAEFTASDDHAVTFLAEQTHNYSGADLRNLCNQAGLGALRRYHMATAGQHLSADESQTLLATQAVTFEDFKLALDTTRPSLYPALLHKYEMWRVHGGMSALATK